MNKKLQQVCEQSCVATKTSSSGEGYLLYDIKQRRVIESRMLFLTRMTQLGTPQKPSHRAYVDIVSGGIGNALDITSIPSIAAGDCAESNASVGVSDLVDDA